MITIHVNSCVLGVVVISKWLIKWVMLILVSSYIHLTFNHSLYTWFYDLRMLHGQYNHMILEFTNLCMAIFRNSDPYWL